MKQHAPPGRPTRRDEQEHHSNPALDGLRAISICLVLAAHLLPLGPKALHLNSTAGPMGMSLFFALSGYLIISTLRSATIPEFVVKRLARILPLAYLYILLIFLLFGLSKQALPSHLGFFVNYRPDQMTPVTEHLWSLCVEVHFYIFVTLLATVGGRRSLALVWPCCLAITAIRIKQGAYIDIATHLRMDEVLAGACIATLPASRLRAIPAPLVIWVLAAGAWVGTSHPDSGWLQYLRPYAAGSLLAATLSQPPNRLIALLSGRVFRYIAAVSYALYVIHPLTAHGWWNDGSVWQRYLFKRPLGFALTLAAAHMSTFYWERAWIQAARRWIRSRRVGNLQSVGRLENVAGE
jgi:peptidoglycan/LPS O-acetylase OafA/YrhL